MPQKDSDELILEVVTPQNSRDCPRAYFNNWVYQNEVSCSCGQKLRVELWEDSEGLRLLLVEDRELR